MGEEIERRYRSWAVSEGLVSFEVVKGESDLFISACEDLTGPAKRLIEECRAVINGYIERCPQFKVSLRPIEAQGVVPQIITEMVEASKQANVGPMAAVAGAVAEYVGKGLLDFSPEVIVENGGDIFIKSSRDRIIGIYAGKSSLAKKVALKIKGYQTPLGICTSSGTVGHSLSFGKADSVTIISKSTPLADAVATAVANIIKEAADITKGIELAKGITGIKGGLIIIEEKLGIWGDMELVKGGNNDL